jgi:hypothetical protein
MSTSQPTLDDIWRLFQETDRLIKAQAQEAERRAQEADRRAQEADRRAQEIDRRFQETERLAQETERRFQETDRQIQQVNRQIGRLGGAWGRFVEDLVAPACEQLFIERGIPVDQVSQRVRRRRQGETLEIDVLVVNRGHVLAVEVKSSLSVADVKKFISDLQRFGEFFPEYADKQLYGAVAGIGIESEADVYANRQGLFVLAEPGDGVVILNDNDFTPRVW